MVITSCNYSHDELRRLVESGGRFIGEGELGSSTSRHKGSQDHHVSPSSLVQSSWRCIGGLSYPEMSYGGSKGSLLATQAFVRLD